MPKLKPNNIKVKYVQKVKVRYLQQKAISFIKKEPSPLPIQAIIAEDCWGMNISKHIKKEYNSPFVALYVMPDCYLKILHNLRWYLSQPLTFIERSQYKYVNDKRRAEPCNNNNHPIGLLHDAEIQFLHYKSKEEALDKWTRRLARLPTDDNRLLIKFSDHFNVTDAQLEEFEKLPFMNKICFVAKPRPNLPSTIWMSECTGDHVPNNYLKEMTLKYFDIDKVMRKST